MRPTLLTFLILGTIQFASANQGLADETSVVGKSVRDFRLVDVEIGKDVRLSDFKHKIVVVIFYSQACTFCRSHEARYRQFAADYASKGVAVLAIDSTGRTAKEAVVAWKERKMGFPLLIDERARAAANLGATAMTTVCIIDTQGKLRYIGAFDDCESGEAVHTRFAADAVNALLAGKRVPTEQTEVYGCLIPLAK